MLSGLLLGVSLNYAGKLWFLSLVALVPFLYVLYSERNVKVNMCPSVFLFSGTYSLQKDFFNLAPVVYLSKVGFLTETTLYKKFCF